MSCFRSVSFAVGAIVNIAVMLKGFAFCQYVTDIILSDNLVTLNSPSQRFVFLVVSGRHHLVVLDSLL